MKFILRTFLFLLYCVLVFSHKQLNDDPHPLPSILPDANHDGFADQNDFYQAFQHTEQTPAQIYDLFLTADTDRNSLVDQGEWSDFYDLFVKDFEERCDTNDDNQLGEAEFELCIEEFPTVNSAISALNKKLLSDEEKLNQVIAVLSTRQRGVDFQGLTENLMINLAEYMYFRRAALSWKDCVSNNDYITKIEVKGCALAIMLPHFHITDNDLNLVWQTGLSNLPADEIQSGKIGFIGFISLFRKYDNFKKYDYNILRDGTLGYAAFMKGIDDGRMPAERITQANVKKLFPQNAAKTDNNKEAVGIDFQAFFILMALSDSVALYGKSSPGTVNQNEYLLMLEEGFVPSGVLSTIDQIQYQYQDEEEDDKDNTPYIIDLERKLMNPTGGQYGGQYSAFLEQYHKTSQHRFLRLKKKAQTKVKPGFEILLSEQMEPGKLCEECRQLFFNMFAVQQVITYHEIGGLLQYALDYIDMYDIWKTIHLFNSCDMDRLGMFYPNIDRKHKNWVIPPDNVQRAQLEFMMDQMDTLPINPVIFASFFRFSKVFRKIGQNHIKSERVVNAEDLEESLELLGLDLDYKEQNQCLESTDTFQIKAINATPPDEILDEIDPKIPYNWLNCFRIGAKSYAMRLEKYTRSHLIVYRKRILRNKKKQMKKLNKIMRN